MQWVTVASACRMQFRAWPLVLKANRGSWRGRRWSCRGKTRNYWLGSPFPELAASLAACASSYLLVTRGSTLTESSWWRETLSTATKHVCPPPPVNLMQSAYTSVKRIAVVSGGKNKCLTLDVDFNLWWKKLRSVFQPQNDRVNGLHPASVAKQQISLTQGVGVMTACTNISPHGKRSSPSIPWNDSCEHSVLWLLMVLHRDVTVS